MYGAYSLFKYPVDPFKLGTTLYTWIGKVGAEGSRDQGKPPLHSQVWSHLWLQESLAPLTLQNLLVVKHMPMMCETEAKVSTQVQGYLGLHCKFCISQNYMARTLFKNKKSKTKIEFLFFEFFLNQLYPSFWNFFYSTISLICSLNLLFSSFYEQWQV